LEVVDRNDMNLASTNAVTGSVVISFAAAGCSSEGYGVGLTLRGTSAVEEFGLHARLRSSSDSGTDTTRDARQDDSFLDFDGRSEGRGLGAQLVFLTPVVDVTTGVQTRDYDGQGTSEGTLGLRWRMYEDDVSTPYLFVDARHTRHESLAAEYVNGWAAGFGVLMHAGRHVYVDSSLAWEGTRGLSLRDGSGSEFEVVYQIGIGFAW